MYYQSVPANLLPGAIPVMQKQANGIGFSVAFCLAFTNSVVSGNTGISILTVMCAVKTPVIQTLQ